MYSRQGYGINSQIPLGPTYNLNYQGCLIAKVQLSSTLAFSEKHFIGWSIVYKFENRASKFENTGYKFENFN